MPLAEVPRVAVLLGATDLDTKYQEKGKAQLKIGTGCGSVGEVNLRFHFNMLWRYKLFRHISLFKGFCGVYWEKTSLCTQQTNDDCMRQGCIILAPFIVTIRLSTNF